MRLSLSLSVPAFLILCLPAAAQKTWYVDVNGTPPGTGTAADPFVSIQQALATPAVVGKDTILVAPGVYAEKLDYLGKPVTVKSTAGPLQTRIDPLPSLGHTVVKLASDASVSINKSTLEGFTVSGKQSQTQSGVRGANDRVVNCIITGFGSGVVTDYDLWVDRCTVVDNLAGFTSSGPLRFAYFRDSILAYNDYDTWGDAGMTGSTFFYCLIEDGVWWGTPPTNLTGDPKLWNPDQGNWHLGPFSPCIDTGDPLAPPDPDGSPRDMGALVYESSYAPPTLVYCTSKVNSDGCTVDIGWSDSAFASASSTVPFLVTGDEVLPNTPGLLFYGFGRRAAPFMGGFHCVEPPTPRVGGQNSGVGGPCGGRFAFEFNAWVQSGADPLLVPGTIVNAQWWYRDLLDPQGFFSSTSDALEFAIAP